MERIKEQLETISEYRLFRILSGSFFFGRLMILVNVFSLLVSWHFNKSILWAIVHYLFGFWYLVYNLLTYRFANGGFMEIINSYF